MLQKNVQEKGKSTRNDFLSDKTTSVYVKIAAFIEDLSFPKSLTFFALKVLQQAKKSSLGIKYYKALRKENEESF